MYELIKCVKCASEKESTLFAKCSAKKNGLQSYCRECATATRYKSPRYRNTLEQERTIQMKYRYGVTKEQFDSIWEKQNGKCCICCAELSFKLRGYAIDHNHDTKTVRGILCNQCNTSLGGFKDSPDIVLAAFNYLIERGYYGRNTA